jgi:uncharacterized protein YpmB
MKSTAALILLTVISLKSFTQSSDGNLYVFKSVKEYSNTNEVISANNSTTCVLIYNNTRECKIKFGSKSDVLIYSIKKVVKNKNGNYRIDFSNGEYLIFTLEFEENLNIFWFKKNKVIRFHNAIQDISKVDCFN